jgi:hypothetical protein
MCTSALAVGLLAAACQQPAPPAAQPPVQPTGPAPGVILSSYTPQQPFREMAPGLLAQTVYATDEAGKYAVEVRDLIVGPGKAARSASFPGAAILEVRSGSGTVTSAGQRRDVRIGSTLSIAEGDALTIENGSAEDALMIRATIVRQRS